MSYDRLAYDEVGETINESVDAKTRNGYAWFRALSAWSPNLTSENVLSFGRIDKMRDGIAAEDDPIVVSDDRIVDFVGLKNDTTFQFSSAHVLKSGVDFRWLGAEYRYSNVISGNPGESIVTRLNPEGSYTAAYAAYRARASSRVATEFGVHAGTGRRTPNDNQLEPALQRRVDGEAENARRCAWHWAASTSPSGSTSCTSRTARPTFSQRRDPPKQAELSLQHGLRSSGVRALRVDVYYRKLSDLRPRYENLFEPIELFPETTPKTAWSIEPEKATSAGRRAAGARRRQSARSSGRLSYALSSADDRRSTARTCRAAGTRRMRARLLFGYRRDERWSRVVERLRSTPAGPRHRWKPEAEMQPDGSIPVRGGSG